MSQDSGWQGYLVPAGEARNEILVVNSRFIASLAPAATVDEAREFIARIRGEFVDASHNVPVYLVGHGNSVTTHCTDDGEPSGTAGRPALAVLQGSGLGDVVVVVTRYFGGTKLGTGGLVRAYGDAVRQVLAVTRRAHKVLTHTVTFALSYALFEQARLLVEAHGGAILDQAFAAAVTITAQFPVERLEGFRVGLRDLSSGGSELLVVQTAPALIPVTAKI